jgi:hypothetical protein
MRQLAGTLALLGCLAPLAGCIPARIVETNGPRVTYAWNAGETDLSRVFQLAASYCNSWNAPPRFVGDSIEGDEHRTTFACAPRPTLPLNRVL